MSALTGKVAQIIGPVLDISFDDSNGVLPNILDALEVTR
ncbi:MAG: F-type H+-transporting ATPase subunit beta, partial [Polaribacter sp.]